MMLWSNRWADMGTTGCNPLLFDFVQYVEPCSRLWSKTLFFYWWYLKLDWFCHCVRFILWLAPQCLEAKKTLVSGNWRENGTWKNAALLLLLFLYFFHKFFFCAQGTSQRTTLLCFHYNSGYLIFLADLPSCGLCNLQLVCWRRYCFSPLREREREQCFPSSFQYSACNSALGAQAGQIEHLLNPSLTQTLSW